MSFGAEIRGFVNGFQAGYKLVKSPQEIEDEALDRRYKESLAGYSEKRLGDFDASVARENERIRISEENAKPTKTQYERDVEEMLGTGPVAPAPTPDVPPVDTTSPGPSGALDTGEAPVADIASGRVRNQRPSDGNYLAFAPVDLQPVFAAAGEQFGLNPNELAHISWKETGNWTGFTSPKGATGVMQFMPDTAAGYGIDPNDPVQSIFAGAHYLRKNLNDLGREDAALAQYNGGNATLNALLKVGKDHLNNETQDYLNELNTDNLLVKGTNIDTNDLSVPRRLAQQYAADAGLPPEALAGQQAIQENMGATGALPIEEPPITEEEIAARQAELAGQGERVGEQQAFAYAAGMGPYNPGGTEAALAADDAASYVTPAEARQEGDVAAQAMAEAPMDVRPQVARGTVEDPAVMDEPIETRQPDRDGLIPITPSELMRKGREAAQAGAEWATDFFQLDKEAGVDTPEMVDGATKFITGYGQPPKALIDLMGAKADEAGTMTPYERKMAGYLGVYQFYADRNRPDDAKKAAGSLLMYDFDQHNKWQAISKVAHGAGDLDGAIEAKVRAYAQIPDGLEIDLKRDKDKNLIMTVTDAGSKETITQRLLSPDEIGAMLTHQDPADFHRSLYALSETAEPEDTSHFQTAMENLANGQEAHPADVAAMTKDQQTRYESEQKRLQTRGYEQAFEQGIGTTYQDVDRTLPIPNTVGPPDERDAGARDFVEHKGTGYITPLNQQLMAQMGPDFGPKYAAHHKQLIDEWKTQHPASEERKPFTLEERDSLKGYLDTAWSTSLEGIPIAGLAKLTANKDVLTTAAYHIVSQNDVPIQDAMDAAINMTYVNPEAGSRGSRNWVATEDPDNPDNTIVQFADGNMVTMPDRTFRTLKDIQDQKFIAMQAQEQQTAATDAENVKVQGQKNARRATEDWRAQVDLTERRKQGVAGAAERQGALELNRPEVQFEQRAPGEQMQQREFDRYWQNLVPAPEEDPYAGIPATVPPVTDPTIRPIPSFGRIGRGY